MKLLRRLLGRARGPHAQTVSMRDMDISEREHALERLPLSPDLTENLKAIVDLTGHSTDVVERRFTAGPQKIKAAVVYIDGLVETAAIRSILGSMELEPFKTEAGPRDGKGFYEVVRERLITNSDLKEVEDFQPLFLEVSGGDTAILIDGVARALVVNTKGWERRTIVEPDAETTIRGPREGFVESIRVNTSLIRRRIRTPSLWMETFTIGSLTKTRVEMVYVKGLAREDLLDELRSRLEGIDTDGILESGYIEEFIDDAPFSVFPTTMRTERPDRVAAALLEGSIAVITDGTPFVLVYPGTFISLTQAPDDYYEIFPVALLIRTLRVVGLMLAIFLPGMYVAVVTFHPELLPTSLLLRIAATREGVPFPVAAEMFFMELLFEILREAGIRLPRAIGPAISIVGALVLGQAAIQAGLVSPAVVIIVALTAISSFTTPVFSLSIAARLLRFGFIILGAVFGLFGIQLGTLLMLVHLCSIRSLGVPYMIPYGPFVGKDMFDSVIRTFRWALDTRPTMIGAREPRRQKPGQRPGPRRIPRRER